MDDEERTYVKALAALAFGACLVIGSCSYGTSLETTKRDFEQRKVEIACIQRGDMLVGNGDCIPPR